MNIWKILQIEPTTNKKEIKKAYSKQLKIYHPEDDPVKFKELQNAYQQAISYANGSDVVEVEQQIEDSSNMTTLTKDKVQFDIHYDPVEQIPPPIPVRNENLFVENNIDKKTDFDVQKYSQYIKENLLSKLPKLITFQDFTTIFDDTIIHTYLNNEAFKNELEEALIKRRYVKDQNQLMLIKDKAKENGLFKLEEAIILKVNTLQNKKGAKIYAFIVFLILFGLIVFSFIPTDSSNEADEEKQISPVERQMQKINEAFLNGYHIEYENGTRVLMDEDDNRIIENIINVKYTQSNIIILYADSGYIAYDTSIKESRKLEFEDVIPLEIRTDGKSNGYGLACLKGEKWYLADLSGNIKEELNGDIKGANCIEYINGKPTLVTIEE